MYINNFSSLTLSFFISFRAIVLIVLVSVSSEFCYSQNYGLSFRSHNNPKEERSGLDLSYEKAFSLDGDFNITFDLKLHTLSGSSYGYILRMIFEDGNNVDIICNNESDYGLRYFYLVTGQDRSLNPIVIDLDILKHEWTTFNLSFYPEENKLTFSALDSLSVLSNLEIDTRESCQINFGACNYEGFKSRDVPPMNLRDIRIHSNNKVTYHWPLNEESGSVAKDKIRDREAFVVNPDWLNPKHNNWEEMYTTKMQGRTQVAVNQQEEIVYLFGKEKMIAYSIDDQSYEIITYLDAPDFMAGCGAIYNPIDNSIYSYNMDDQSFSIFDLATKLWQIRVPEDQDLTSYWHHNNYFSEKDTSLYLFGGYGHHEYKNIIMKCDLNSANWEEIQSAGYFFEPRYLAACAGARDTLYILGGYGSHEGNQMLNPQNYAHLLAYSLNDKRFIKKFDLTLPLQDISFANSIVLNDKDQTYFALAFPQFNEDGFLQLVKGSLSEPSLELMADELPYLFHDIKSYADLYHFPESKKLVAYTSYFDDDEQTTLRLYSLLYPPNIAVAKAKEGPGQFIASSAIILISTISVVGFAVIVLLVYRRKKKRTLTFARQETVRDLTIEPYDQEDDEQPTKESSYRSTILFFGGFQVFDKHGIDITGKFTPLLKELFLLLWLNTLKNKKGISSEKLTEILWSDKSESSARNNKSVNIAKLRSILNEIGQCEVTHKTGYWKIICDEKDEYNDYREFIKITESKTNLSKQNIQRLIKIVEKGAFLPNLNHDWLDNFKSSISETLIETLYSFAKELDIKKEASLVIHIADSIFSCDSINEEAMVLKCKAHYEMGAHSLSKNCYTKFCKDYKELYDQEYDKSFATVTSILLAEIINF